MNDMQVCVSEWLCRDYPAVYMSLCNALEKSNVKYQTLYNTKEVWVRDAFTSGQRQVRNIQFRARLS